MVKEYKTLEKVIEYDHEKAEEYADALMELRSLNARVEYLEELLEDNADLADFMWTTLDQRTAPVHKLEDDHLQNIMTYLLKRDGKISDVIKAEARNRGFDIPVEMPRLSSKIYSYDDSVIIDPADIDF